MSMSWIIAWYDDASQPLNDSSFSLEYNQEVYIQGFQQEKGDRFYGYSFEETSVKIYQLLLIIRPAKQVLDI